MLTAAAEGEDPLEELLPEELPGPCELVEVLVALETLVAREPGLPERAK